MVTQNGGTARDKGSSYLYGPYTCSPQNRRGKTTLTERQERHDGLKTPFSPLWSLFSSLASRSFASLFKKITKSQTVTQYRHVAAGPERGQRRRFE